MDPFIINKAIVNSASTASATQLIGTLEEITRMSRIVRRSRLVFVLLLAISSTAWGQDTFTPADTNEPPEAGMISIVPPSAQTRVQTRALRQSPPPFEASAGSIAVRQVRTGDSQTKTPAPADQ